MSDLSLAAASCLSSNLIEHFPRLRIAFIHGGGTLAMLPPRLEQARKLYDDTLVFDTPTLRHLVDRFGATRGLPVHGNARRFLGRAPHHLQANT